MKRYTTHALIVFNLIAVALLAWLWVDRDGQLRHVKWTPPTSITPDFSASVAASAMTPSSGNHAALTLLERPLFSPSRRPPPPVAVTAAAQVPSDPLGNLQVQGIYAGGVASGIIASVDGVSKRIAVNDTIGGWTLRGVEDREVTFVRDAQIRTVKLLRNRPTPSAAAAALPSAAPNNVALPSAPTAAVPQSSLAQKMEDEARDLLRRRNALRARAGLQPVAP